MWTQLCPGRSWATRMPQWRPPSPGTLPDIFFLVLLCDRNVSAVGLQFMLKNPPEGIVLHAEGVVQHGGDIVLSVGVRTEDGGQTFAAAQQRTEHERGRSRGQTDRTDRLPPQSCRRSCRGQTQSLCQRRGADTGRSRGTPAPRPCSPDPRLPPSQEGDGSPTIL